MSKTSIATFQTVWDCRWSRPGFRLAGVDDAHQPESIWVCIHTGRRRPVTNAECESCEHWQRTDLAED